MTRTIKLKNVIDKITRGHSPRLFASIGHSLTTVTRQLSQPVARQLSQPVTRYLAQSVKTCFQARDGIVSNSFQFYVSYSNNYETI